MLVHKKFSAGFVSRDILNLIRTFPSKYVIIERASLTASVTSLGEQTKTFNRVWAGEALVKPGSGTVQRLEQGQIQTDHPTILVPQSAPVETGDFVHLDGLLYQVTAPADFFGAYLSLEMNLYQQQP